MQISLSQYFPRPQLLGDNVDNKTMNRMQLTQGNNDDGKEFSEQDILIYYRLIKRGRFTVQKENRKIS